jgi:hypothetical protein
MFLIYITLTGQLKPIVNLRGQQVGYEIQRETLTVDSCFRFGAN